MSKVYTGDYLDRVAFPLGGMGAGMICLEGTGALSHVSIRNKPDVFNEPCIFSAVCVKGEANIARVLEGPVPGWKAFGMPESGNGSAGKTYGLPRFSKASFSSRFPFATVELSDDKVPLDVHITGWSPFVPGNSDDSSLPVAALEYRFHNPTSQSIEAVYSFNAHNFMDTHSGGAGVLNASNGLTFHQPGSDEKPWEEGSFCACVDTDDAAADCVWTGGGSFDALTMAWKNVLEGKVISRGPLGDDSPSPGGSIYVPLKLNSGETLTVNLMLSWYVPETDIAVGGLEDTDSCCGGECKNTGKPTHKPWYSGKFDGIHSVAAHWRENYDSLRAASVAFSDCFFDTTLPEELVEAVEANLTILKSPTVLRQTDGRLWCWEGCSDSGGCCHGSCTHVWNYAQALPHLFPDLERTLRETEFFECQNEQGHQAFRAALPIGPTPHDFHAAADGQLGGIIKLYRDWRIGGDTRWLTRMWPRVKQSLDYCIKTWDPDRQGVLKEPHHNTYDIEFWGPDGMCTSVYLGALAAAGKMAEAMAEDIPLYRELLDSGRRYMEQKLFNDDYYEQEVMWKEPHGGEPKYQYGTGCISDGVIGCWMSEVAGVEGVLDPDHVKRHLASIYKHNLLHDLSEHSNPQRPGFALGDDGGLLLCSWPRGGKPLLPFVYSDEVWTGIEYQVAAHMMMNGMVDDALDVVRTARGRYDGKKRNPYNEYECGHWYARAMSSYSMIQGITGIRYDAVEKVLHVKPKISGDFRSFLSTSSGYATAGVRDGKPFLDVTRGEIRIDRIEYVPC